MVWLWFLCAQTYPRYSLAWWNMFAYYTGNERMVWRMAVYSFSVLRNPLEQFRPIIFHCNTIMGFCGSKIVFVSFYVNFCKPLTKLCNHYFSLNLISEVLLILHIRETCWFSRGCGAIVVRIHKSCCHDYQHFGKEVFGYIIIST